MADASVAQDPQPSKASKTTLVLGVVLMLLGGGGGFFLVSSGMILAPESKNTDEVDKAPKGEFSGVSFVPMEPVSVSLPPSSAYKHLRFRAELEVNEAYQSDVKKILPRIVDVLNSYLRAVEPADLAAPASLTRLRAQMLRRAQIVAGPGRVQDLLIMEFVLN